MARDLNTVQLVGRLVRDVIVKELGSGATVGEFSLAVHHPKRNGDDWIEETSFFDCEIFRNVEGIIEYLKKGKQIAIDGTLRQDRWRSSEGEGRSRVKVLVNSLQLLADPTDRIGNDHISVSGPMVDGIPF